MLIPTGRRYTQIRWIVSILFLGEVGIRWVLPSFSEIRDLYIFHATSLLSALFILLSPKFNDRIAQISTAVAICIWSAGSFLTSWDAYHQSFIWRGFGETGYVLFYPFLFFGLLRTLTVGRAFKPLEIFDVTIITLGASSVISSFFLRLNQHSDTFTYFLSIFYPIADSLILIFVTAIVMMQKISWRSALTFLGILSFATSDYLFLFQSQNGAYSLGSLVDSGWILGFLLIMEGQWHPPVAYQSADRFTAAGTMFVLLASSLLLVYSTINPNELSAFSIVPALLTIFLSFIRMGIALRDARLIHDERELARTDELTGLNNRRRFIAALDQLANKESSLLLLDLDGFKHINDSLGHESGDLLLKEVATRFARQMPRASLLARLGGDEFGVIVYGPSEIGLEVARSLGASLSYPMRLGGHDVRVGVSIGLVANDGQGELMRRADEAMYSAKRNGSGITQWNPTLA